MGTDLQLTQPQKAAALLVAMGKENASKLLSHFKQEEIRELMLASNQMTTIPPETLNLLIEEFETEMMNGPSLMDSGASFQTLIEESLTEEQLLELKQDPSSVEIARQSAPFWDALDDVDLADLTEFLLAENTLAAAYTITRLSPEKSAKLVNSLSKEDRSRVVAGMITNRSASPAAINILENVLREEFSRSTEAEPNSDSPRKVAGLFNELDTEISDELFKDLASSVDAQDLKNVKSLMFKFENILWLEATNRAIVFDQVPTEVTGLALRDVEPDLQEAVLAALGQRTRRMLESELGNPSNATVEDIEKARKQIASTVLRLSAEGLIIIPVQEDMAA